MWSLSKTIRLLIATLLLFERSVITYENDKVEIEIEGRGTCNINDQRFMGSMYNRTYVFEANGYVGDDCNFALMQTYVYDYIVIHLEHEPQNGEILKLEGFPHPVVIDKGLSRWSCLGFPSNVLAQYINRGSNKPKIEFTVIWGAREQCPPGRKCYECIVQKCLPSLTPEIIYIDREVYIPSKYISLHCKGSYEMHIGWIFLILIVLLILICVCCGIFCMRKRKYKIQVTSVQASPYFPTLPEINPTRIMNKTYHQFAKKTDVSETAFTSDKHDEKTKTAYSSFASDQPNENIDDVENTYTYI